MNLIKTLISNSLCVCILIFPHPCTSDENIQRGLSRPNDFTQTPIDLLGSLLKLSEDNLSININSKKQSYKIDKDYLELEVSVKRKGYLYLLSEGSSGSWTLLFPNSISNNNLLATNSTTTLPDKNWPLIAQGPPGESRLLAIVSTNQSLFRNIGQPLGPFKSFSDKQATFVEISTRGNDCESIDKQCDGVWGAAIVILTETD